MNLKALKGIALLLLMAFILSCKKDKKIDPPASTGTGYSTNLVEGYFELEKVIDVYSDSVGTPSCGTTFRLFDRRIHKDSVYAYEAANVGTISFNGIAVGKYRSDYLDTTHTNFSPPFKIKNTGSDTGNFHVDLTFSQKFPTYTGFSSLPDTIYRESEMVVKVKNYSNCNFIQVWLGDGSTMLLLKQLSVGDSIVRFEKRLSGFDIFLNFPQITLIFAQEQVQIINNKNYYVITSTQYRIWGRPFSYH